MKPFESQETKSRDRETVKRNTIKKQKFICKKVYELKNYRIYGYIYIKDILYSIFPVNLLSFFVIF